MKKYKLITNDYQIINGYKVYRIIALTDIYVHKKDEYIKIKKNTLGGFLMSENNLSHEGGCWIHNNSIVMHDAVISGETQVDGFSIIGRGVSITDGIIINTSIHNNCILGGNLRIENSSLSNGVFLHTDKQIINCEIHQSKIIIDHINLTLFKRYIRFLAENIKNGLISLAVAKRGITDCYVKILNSKENKNLLKYSSFIYKNAAELNYSCYIGGLLIQEHVCFKNDLHNDFESFLALTTLNIEELIHINPLSGYSVVDSLVVHFLKDPDSFRGIKLRIWHERLSMLFPEIYSESNLYISSNIFLDYLMKSFLNKKNKTSRLNINLTENDKRLIQMNDFSPFFSRMPSFITLNKNWMNSVSILLSNKEITDDMFIFKTHNRKIIDKREEFNLFMEPYLIEEGEPTYLFIGHNSTGQKKSSLG